MSGSANTHSKLSPSGAKRWANCTASVKYIEDNADRIPEEKESVFAAEGTQAHDYAEAALIQILDEGMSRDEAVANIPEDFREPLAVYIDECLDHVTSDGEHHIEAKVPLFYRPEDTGTCDFGHVDEEDGLKIIDLKYGAGVLVRAEGNEQLAIYAQSFVTDLDYMYDFKDDTPVCIEIVQPRYRGEDPISVWELSVGELREFTVEIAKRAEAIQIGGKTVFAPSEGACKWCPAKGFCVARMNIAIDAIPDDLDILSEDFDKVAPDTITDEQMVILMSNKKLIEGFLSDVCDHLQERALAGDPAEGTKVVRGNMGNTKWADEEAALKYLAGQGLKSDERHNMKPISPTAAKKLLAEKLKNPRVNSNFSKLTTRAAGKLTLALDSDKREAVPCGGEAFDELEGMLD